MMPWAQLAVGIGAADLVDFHRAWNLQSEKRGRIVEQSPYASPKTDQTIAAAPQASRERLLAVATRQRQLLFALLAGIVLNIVTFMTPLGQSDDFGVKAGILAATVVVVIFMIIAMFRLARVIANLPVAIICSLLMVVPCISLIM